MRASIGDMTRTHGMTNTRLYEIWCGMKKRCSNKNYIYFCNYGGRGITVCDEWLNDFKSFYDWAINNGYSDDLSIDRIDNDKGYSPDNCRFSTREEQSNNRRSNIVIEIDGETKTATQWARLFGIEPKLVHKRLRKGWLPEKALKTPPTQMKGEI